MFQRTYLGLDFGPQKVCAIALRRAGRRSVLLGGRETALAEGTIGFSAHRPNIRDSQRFVETVRELLDPLARREERVALSLPDVTGRVLLTESETAFKSREEGVDILKWQMKGALPCDPKEIHLDYQVLEHKETGAYRLVVAYCRYSVLHQYEELLSQAGYSAVMVDFQSLNLYNFYRPRLDLGEDFVLVGVVGNWLQLLMFQGRKLMFHRVADGCSDVGAVFREVTRSLAGSQKVFPGLRRAAVYLHSDWRETEPLSAALSSAFEKEVINLDPHLERMVATIAGGRTDLSRRVVAAIGAAERMMR